METKIIEAKHVPKSVLINTSPSTEQKWEEMQRLNSQGMPVFKKICAYADLPLIPDEITLRGIDDPEAKVIIWPPPKHLEYRFLPFAESFNLYEKAQRLVWVPSAINFAMDSGDLNCLSISDQVVFVGNLSYLRYIDGVVLQNIPALDCDIEIMAGQSFYKVQSPVELVHGLCYDTAYKIHVTDPDMKKQWDRAIFEDPVVANIRKWVEKYMTKDRPFVVRLIANAQFEGIGLQPGFAIIFGVKQAKNAKGCAPFEALRQMNEWIARDESSHVDNGAAILNDVLHEIPTEAYVHEMTRELVALLKDLVHSFRVKGEAETVRILTARAEKMIAEEEAKKNEEKYERKIHLEETIQKLRRAEPATIFFRGEMTEDKWFTYIESVANAVLARIKYAPPFNATSPFEWMENIMRKVRTAQFETLNTTYSKAPTNTATPAHLAGIYTDAILPYVRPWDVRSSDVVTTDDQETESEEDEEEDEDEEIEEGNGVVKQAEEKGHID